MSSAAQPLPDQPVPSVAAVPDPPRQRDAERTRAEILDVAIKEFADRGYAGARVDEIADKTSTTKRMIYYYFGGKEQLYVAVLERSYKRIRRLEQQLDVEHLDPVQAVRELAGLTFDHHEAHPEFIRLVSIENIHRAVPRRCPGWPTRCSTSSAGSSSAAGTPGCSGTTSTPSTCTR